MNETAVDANCIVANLRICNLLLRGFVVYHLSALRVGRSEVVTTSFGIYEYDASVKYVKYGKRRGVMNVVYYYV